MKGSIFTTFEEFVTERFGPDAYEHLLDEAELETTDPFVGPGTYPAGDMVALVTTASVHTGLGVDELLQAFGRYAFAYLARSVPSLMDGLEDPATFLQGLESVIHTEVRKLYPDAEPPRFDITEVEPGVLDLAYQSSLGLFALAEGLLEGLGDWYGQPMAIERTSTDGTNAVFRVWTGVGRSEGSSGSATEAVADVEVPSPQ